MVAPRDLRAGGTWLGVNEAGLFAALTNRPAEVPDRSRRSRGLLVTDALARGSAASAAEALSRLPADAYNPFNLLVSDGQRAFVAVYDEKPRVTELGAGPHVVCNADPDDRRVPKVARLLDEAGRVAAGRADDALGALAAVCRTHHAGAGPLADPCIHAGGYGTRSSTLLRIAGAPGGHALLFADGPPCETDYEDLTPLLGELDRKAGVSRGFDERTVA